MKNGPDSKIRGFRIGGIPTTLFEKGQRVPADGISALHNNFDINAAIRARVEAATRRRSAQQEE